MDERENLISLVDWVQFTIPLTSDLQVVYDLLGIPSEEWKDMPKGLFSYAKQKAAGGIKLLYEPISQNADMGIHILMSGQACREYETYFGRYNWEQLFNRVLVAGGHFTRLDLAVDEKRYHGEKPYFKIRTLVGKVKRNECRSKFRSARRIEKLNIGDGSSLGNTVYFGSPQSLIEIRAYEKNFERENAGKQVEEQLTTWNRVEIEMRDERAQMAVYAICSGMPSGQLVFGILSNYLNFVDRQQGDTNKARWPISKWWLNYLDGAKKLVLALQAPDKTIDQKQTWLVKQVIPTFAEVWYALGGPGADFFSEILTEGMDRMNEAQWQRAEQYREQLQREFELLAQKKQEKYEAEEGKRKFEAYRRMYAATDKTKDRPSADGQ
ncbi:replication initiation factor domain-containing protein [Paenibacillus ehimensis]|uniref:Replication initiation factor domain-containing protein n=1 Tax=Paenibacillus ehimensis TaxID=79264 RepID=A0ABT8VMC2_9BACL|nr:replication initiation factor domain-containing protein [Paenibacillus ehimensis]MDO3682096.1 replication initiation factor domain-containing protein [Paenibacillus ehimensis]